MRVRGVALALTVAMAAAGCSEEAADPPPTPAPATSSPGGAASLEVLANAFGCEDLHDVGTGGNPGLAAFGVCHLGRHNIDIYLTTNRAQWEQLADQFPSVLGPNWIIVCPTGAKTARIVHERIGGTLKIP